MSKNLYTKFPNLPKVDMRGIKNYVNPYGAGTPIEFVEDSYGKRVEFDRDKLARSILIAFRKRPIEDERIEKMITGLVRRLESSGDSEVLSIDIGEMVMDTLSEIDQVAYVRFASVYRNFREARDFEKFVGGLTSSISKK